MIPMKLSDLTHVHFVGIGGIGVSALARLCLHEGKTVSGSDSGESAITKKLSEEGAKVFIGHAEEQVPEATSLLVYSEAVQKDNPELKQAKKLGIDTINYFDALGMFLNDHFLIAVAGSHGKTTTTAMLADIFEAAELDPTVVVGSLRGKTGSNFRAGKSKYAIVEACEFRRDFLSLQPDVLVITNIEYEHVDYYKNLEDVQAAFRELADKVSEDGVIVTNTDDPHIATALANIDRQVIDYTQFFDPQFELPFPGVHNHLNAAAAVAAANFCGVDVYLAKEALKNFTGTWRRFERKGKLNGAQVVDDYAHHPTELKATIAAAREVYPDKRLVVAFQPHLRSRTEELYDDFVNVLVSVDEVILFPIYEAREEKGYSVTSEELRVSITGKNPHAKFFETFEEGAAYLKETVTADDVVIVMGAGKIATLATMLVE